MRDMINKSLELISFFIVFILFFSCTGEIEDETGSKTGTAGKVQIALQIPITAGDATSFTTRSEVDNESTIRNLTLFFFDSSGIKKFATYIDLSKINGSSSDVDMNRWANEKVITILNADILAQLSESRNVHVVANYGNISNTAKEADLNDIITNTINTDISSPTADKPLVMHGADLNHVFATNSKATVSLVRNVAKVQMTLTTTNFTLGGKKISLAPESTSPSALSSAKVINQADRSFLVSSKISSPSDVSYFNGANTTVVVDSRTTPGTTTFVPHINYINENLRESYSVETNVTALILQIPYQVNGGEININNYYKILINNVDGNDKYKINRNTIYDITASISTLGGETDASAVLVKGTLNVLPWDENTLTSDLLTLTSLWVEKSTIQIGKEGTLAYKTDALFSSDPQLSECSVTSDTPWLKVSLTSDTEVKLVASPGEGYKGDTRIGKFKLKVRNLVKVITVTQAPTPTTGSIKLDPHTLTLWKETPLELRKVKLTVENSTDSWLMTEGDRTIATCNSESGTGSWAEGDHQLIFACGTSYGSTEFKFVNLNTMEYDSIQVTHRSSNPVEIPACDYLLIMYDWKDTGGADLDTATEFINTGLSNVDNRALGYHLYGDVEWNGDRAASGNIINTNTTGGSGKETETGNPTKDKGAILTDPSGATILAWGGDNTNANAKESFYIDVKNLLINKNNLPDLICINLYAIWYGSVSTTAIQMKVDAYTGGTMERYPNDYKPETLQRNFHHVGGTGGPVTNSPFSKVISAGPERVMYSYRNKYESIGCVIFDKGKNKATLVIYGSTGFSATSSRSANVNVPLRLK